MPRLSLSRYREPLLVIALSVSALLFVAIFSKADLIARMRQSMLDAQVDANGQSMISQGRNIFRHDTFGDEDFWGGTLKLHQAIEGAANGGVGPGVSPKTALGVGLKVDIEALPQSVIQGLRKGQVNLDDPKTTLALLQLGAVVGLKGDFNSDGSL